MNRLAIALDLGTSGFRAQAMDLVNGEMISTVITNRHPLPGTNVIDHLHFALEFGVETARDLILEAINKILGQTGTSLDDVIRLAVCGNPTQLSLFQGMEIRDLAFAGSRKLQALGVTTPARTAEIRSAGEFPGLRLPKSCDIIIPPAVHDEVGADALALIIQSGILDCEETAIAIDYGTNAEMALSYQGRLFTGSAAAGPALEGQHINCGTLAMPGAIVDMEAAGPYHRLLVLDSNMLPTAGALIDLRVAGEVVGSTGPVAKAITGTGVIAALDQALEAGIISLPEIRTADRQLHFGGGIFLSEADLGEAGKAIGAIRAGYVTLGIEAGIAPIEIRTAYLAGASGTYVDAHKSGRLGLIPPCVDKVKQVGNTSLAMARELVLAPSKLAMMADLAETLRHTHTMFAKSKIFSQLFLLELSRWTEGMPMATYREMLSRFHLPDLPESAPMIVQAMKRDISDLGKRGLTILGSIGLVVALQPQGCLACMGCMEICPAGALAIDTNTNPTSISLNHALCNGVACRRCEPVCEPKVFHLTDFFGAKRATASEGA
ncbi:MAG: 4Fe-4S ferredoxin [gamma proteobacterium symbiont of Ctena orbiculata]|nr:MAG: 4Fe-4S ferredoxin [gamma proteobacterium symbiont of Ctena orbiculata]PVV22660.1 MAG: 4Fe-4S ferredoxin [gamma proteobacterium symbiont of Ctena orbiculata]PVV25392.1 MAG: 4Fe-4S ferredoxin [gamma proteobacterium symbiont of Ctena orbiculata]